MKLPIRFFGIGLLTASVIFSISVYFFNDQGTNLEEVSIDDLSSYLETQGYHLVTQEQYISLAVKEREEQVKNNEEESTSDKSDDKNEKEDNSEKDAEKNSDEKPDEKSDNKKKDSKDKSEENKDDNKKKDNKKKDNKKKVYKYTLKVEPNMLGPTVSKLLEDNKIIKDADAFTKYLEDNDYSRFIQLGEHELTSEMTHYEIAEKITSN